MFLVLIRNTRLAMRYGNIYHLTRQLFDVTFHVIVFKDYKVKAIVSHATHCASACSCKFMQDLWSHYIIQVAVFVGSVVAFWSVFHVTAN